ncbi:hypothetical protein [Litoreibacter albidus]|uniref:N-(5'-phosphoribosyl)anthranilate isomerase n=1 Tax=Litoreibacter albidus TaxID=670155 RepID=A0A1H3A227_9RHOB|nr:hypothetical protein SAMN04488001_2693 [Litoreibacter albidus]
MEYTKIPMTPEAWFRHLFKSKAALGGGVVRRNVRDMERMVGRQTFYRELARRGYSAVENAGQVVVFCNAEDIQMTARLGQTLVESLVENPLRGFRGRVSSKL